MSVNPSAGQPGNALPIVAGTTSDTFKVDYGLTAQFKRNVVAINATAAAYTVSSSMSGSVFTYGGCASGVTITLPTPEVGLWFDFTPIKAIASAGTVFTCGTSGAIITVGDSGGADALAGASTIIEFAIAGPGCWLSFIGISSAKYIARQTKSGSSAASTGNFAISS